MVVENFGISYRYMHLKWLHIDDIYTFIFTMVEEYFEISIALDALRKTYLGYIHLHHG